MNNPSNQHAIVIGGGIAGCSSAYALAKRGWQVTLIEREPQLALGASGNPLGVLYARLTGSQTALNTLTINSFKHSVNLLQNLGLAPDDYQACGVLQLSFNARELTRHKSLLGDTNVESCAENSVADIAQYLSPSQASEVAGIALNFGGIYIKNAGWVNPVAYCRALANADNIKICYSNTAISMHKQDDLWLVRDTQNLIAQAAVVIIANAYDAKQFSQTQHCPLTPVRGQTTLLPSNAITRPLKTVVCADSHISPAVSGVHHIGTTFVVNDPTANLRIDDHRQNLSMLIKISAQMAAELNPTLNPKLNLESTDFLSALKGRVGWRCQTPDYLPLAGPLLDAEQLTKNPPRYNANIASLPWLQGLYINAGHGSKGLITAPYCAELIAQHITQTALASPQNLLHALNPNRFLLRQLGLKQLAKSIA